MSPSNIQTSRRREKLDKDKEFEYMLKELDHERQLMETSRKGLEQSITYYLTIVTAVAGGVVATAVATTGIMLTIVFVLALFLVTGIGHFTFWQLLGGNVQIVLNQSFYYARRQYFLDAFPRVSRYIGSSSAMLIPDTWQRVFNRGMKTFLYLYAIFNSILLGLFVYTAVVLTVSLIYGSGQVLFGDVKVLANILSIITFCSAVILNIVFLLRHVKMAKKLSHRVSEQLK